MKKRLIRTYLHYEISGACCLVTLSALVASEATYGASAITLASGKIEKGGSGDPLADICIMVVLLICLEVAVAPVAHPVGPISENGVVLP